MAAIIFKCPNCGGDLRFNPEMQNFKCEYCLSEFSRDHMEKDVAQQTGEAISTDELQAPEELESSADRKSVV